MVGQAASLRNFFMSHFDNGQEETVFEDGAYDGIGERTKTPSGAGVPQRTLFVQDEAGCISGGHRFANAKDGMNGKNMIKFE